jgi:hypothetical protein
MAKVSHPNAVAVYEVSRAADHLFIAITCAAPDAVEAHAH